MRQTRFHVPKMDCPSEEQMIRMAVEPAEIVRRLDFDLEGRRVTVTHTGEASTVLELLEPLGLGATLEATGEATANTEAPPQNPAAERRVLRALLAINGVMFMAELGVGFAAESTGLVADSLDMLADALVYGISLAAVGRAVSGQRRAARLSGWFQALLAAGALVEVGRRALGGSEPVEAWMIGMAAVALAANLLCVALLARHRRGGLHLRASWIFSTNDALANLGVILAGVLVGLTGSAIPDLVIGTLIAGLVLSGAVRILRLRPGTRGPGITGPGGVQPP